MQEEVMKSLKELLDSMIAGMKATGEFAMQQIPDVIQQALTWFMVESLLAFVSGLFLFFWGMYCYKVAQKKHTYDDSYPSYKVGTFTDYGIFAASISGSCSLVGVILMACNITWLQILIAPKWFILTKMMSLL